METKKIELTPLELKMLQENVNREFESMNATAEEAEAMNSVLAKAEALMDELDAFDELDNSLMEWYLSKYEAQEAEK